MFICSICKEDIGPRVAARKVVTHVRKKFYNVEVKTGEVDHEGEPEYDWERREGREIVREILCCPEHALPYEKGEISPRLVME